MGTGEQITPPVVLAATYIQNVEVKRKIDPGRLSHAGKLSIGFARRLHFCGGIFKKAPVIVILINEGNLAKNESHGV